MASAAEILRIFDALAILHDTDKVVSLMGRVPPSEASGQWTIVPDQSPSGHHMVVYRRAVQ